MSDIVKDTKTFKEDNQSLVTVGHPEENVMAVFLDYYSNI